MSICQLLIKINICINNENAVEMSKEPLNQIMRLILGDYINYVGTSATLPLRCNNCQTVKWVNDLNLTKLSTKGLFHIDL